MNTVTIGSRRSVLKSMGLATFLFFLVKGIFWLVVSAVLLWMA